MSAAGIDQETAFRTEVAARFGLVPNFFQTAGEAPGLIRQLWGFAKAAYLDNPLPPGRHQIRNWREG